MNLSTKAILQRLGAGESIPSLCQAAAISRSVFASWWKAETTARLPSLTGTRRVGVSRSVQIARNAYGIPSIFADNDEDLFFGFGYAVAQDRLFQLDYLRRRGAGRLAEILGADGSELDLMTRVAGLKSVVEVDLLARTVGIQRIAEHEWATLSADTQSLLIAFSRGVNAVIDESHGRLPIEFDLLNYKPEPWSPVDCLTIEGEFRWYLTGRFPVVVMPELAKRTLGEGPLYQVFLESELDDESILPPGAYPSSRVGSQPVGTAAGDPEAGSGSNNWVVSGRRTATGKPLLASDPHIAFEAVSCWYQVSLCGGSFHVAGMAYVGMPAVMFGRTEGVAWGCTNNICSQRDLYQEKTDSAHLNCFLYDGQWEPARQREEIIQVKGGAPLRKTVRASRNGPIVDEVLPPPARQTGPVALKWLGAHQGGWLTALLDMDRAQSLSDFREALRPWYVPTFSVVFADRMGHIGYHAAGRIPIRKVWARGYRPGWEPEHHWDGLVPFEGMPQWTDPERGWIATANNRPAANDFPYPLSGTWNDGLRALRIRQMLESKSMVSPEAFGAMHRDALALRAVRCLPGLLKVLKASTRKFVQEAAESLQAWDCRMEPDRVGATLFEVFFVHWTRVVVQQHFEGETAALLAGGAASLAATLLTEDCAGWFKPGSREPAIEAALETAQTWLAQRLGQDRTHWTWGRLHTLPLRHVLSGRGDLGSLLDHGGLAVPGNATTVCNTTPGAHFEARLGGGYRMIADLSTEPPALLAIDAQGQSGHPGSPYYGQQLKGWLEGQYHELRLDRLRDAAAVVHQLNLIPTSEGTPHE